MIVDWTKPLGMKVFCELSLHDNEKILDMAAANNRLLVITSDHRLFTITLDGKITEIVEIP